ncbi:hypothetical protein RB596_009163 [Gaeumannomyces avenae]
MLSFADNPADRGQPAGVNNGPIRRIARSKNGCVTCRRRKVRCDEQRPRCSHCERLNLHCQWRPLIHTTSAPGTSRRASSTPNGSTRLAHAELSAGRRSDAQSPDNLGSIASPASGQLLSLKTGQPGAGVDQFFDYASFMWSDAAGLWGQFGVSAGDESMPLFSQDASLRLGTPTTASVSTDTGRRLDLALRDAAAQERQMASPQSSQYSNALAAPASIGLSVFRGEDSDLLTYFVHTVVPPILAEVETQKKWASMRRVLISMAAASTMVRYAILAFSNLLRCRRETPWSQVNQHYYENATKELDAAGDLPSPERHSSRRQSLLATLFFLCYIDILEERNETTHANLKRAYTVFRQGDKRGFHPVEMHLLSWIRLLDARAVSAGGEGLFLTDQDETLLVQPSPGSLHDSTKDAAEGAADRAVDLTGGLLHADAGDRDIEDVLFELLYQPGIVFYQKVQSFMGRISKIDPWHRSRGTVEDETEVMNIAAGILRDLRALLADGCPALMPHAVAGKLKAPYVSRYLAFTITRAFRTYLSNYYASKLHLHRVAYRHLPLSSESKDALAQIRHLARLMVDDAGPVPDKQHEQQQQRTDMTSPMAAGEPEGAIISDARFASAAAEDANTSGRGQPQQDEQEQQQQHSQQPQLPVQATLPVNMLWPLLMWGTEEKDPAERDWIRDQILRMENVASNARATAQVLEEVQRRQDATNTRQDVRAVMHTVFDSCWAIV